MKERPASLTISIWIDRFNEVLCKSAFTLLMIPLILANVYEVVSRYVFHAPTVWAQDITTISFGALFMLGAAYTLYSGAHIRTDIFWDKFSPRTKGIIDSVAYLILFIPSMCILLYISWDAAVYAYEINERASSGIWRFVIWPFRMVVPLSVALLLLQGISELLKSLHTARTGILLSQHEKIEV